MAVENVQQMWQVIHNDAFSQNYQSQVCIWIYRIRPNKRPGRLQNYSDWLNVHLCRFLIINWAHQFLNKVSIIFVAEIYFKWSFNAEIYFKWSFNEFFTLSKLKIQISWQWNMIETCFRNWHVEENQLYKLGKGEGCLLGQGCLLRRIRYMYWKRHE